MRSLEEWKARRESYREQIREMLGLSPFPPRTDLKAAIVGKVESEKFVVEKISLQSLPGLYVTANLYLPRKLAAPAPAILYLCGHARVVKDGIAYGNKANYQHHAAWFAEHGYVALIIDTSISGKLKANITERTVGSGGGGRRAVTPRPGWRRGMPSAHSIIWPRVRKSTCSVSVSRDAAGVAPTPGFSPQSMSDRSRWCRWPASRIC